MLLLVTFCNAPFYGTNPLLENPIMANAQKSIDAPQDGPINECVYDCAIIGGGPAGLSAAIYLGRMRRKVIVLDIKEGRSSWHQVNRNYLGFLDGIHATALREIGQKQAEQYGAEFLDAHAIGITREGDASEQLFHVTTDKGAITARTLILATGVSDSFPEFEGSEDCIGKSIFWCIICDGYEAINRRIVVLGHGSRAASLALELLVFTQDVTLVSWDAPLNLPSEKLDALHEHGIRVIDSNCNFYQCSKGELSSLRLEDGTELELDMLFVAQGIEPHNELAKQLNCNLDDHGFLVVDTEQSTNVAGVYAAGDVTRLHNHQIASAVHEGGMAAAAANYYLYEDWQKED